MTCHEVKFSIKVAGENPSPEFLDGLCLQIKQMHGDEKIRAAGTYLIHKHIEALKALACGEPDKE